jgi:hypothetical protein
MAQHFAWWNIFGSTCYGLQMAPADDGEWVVRLVPTSRAVAARRGVVTMLSRAHVAQAGG